MNAQNVKVIVENSHGSCLGWDQATSWRDARRLLADFADHFGRLDSETMVKIVVEDAHGSCLQWNRVGSWSAAQREISDYQAEFGLIEPMVSEAVAA